MAHYLVHYTIESDLQREEYEKFLHARGFDQEVDQSTRFGEDRSRTVPLLITELEQKAALVNIEPPDTITFYYGEEDDIRAHQIVEEEQ